MKKLIIFDFDGTIANTEEASYQVYLMMAEQYGMPLLSREELKSYKKIPLRQRIKEQGIPYYLLPKLISESQSKLSQFMNDAKKFEGIDQVIKKLETDRKLIIVSSNRKRIIKSFLKKEKLDSFVKVFGSASLFGKSATIQKAIKKLKISPKHALYIGDEVRDLVACKEANVDMIAVSWGYDDISLLAQENAKYIASDIDELMNYVKIFDLKLDKT
jgi:phosphoglycolate phosphatase